MQVRPIHKDEQPRFEEMERYCFGGNADDSPMFPLKGEAVAWGAFDGGEILSGVVEVPFQVHLFGEVVAMVGIGGVASLPEHRNRGTVRAIHEAILTDAHRRGVVVSSLYPFSFGFYGKFGFGDLGPCYTTRFPPEDIRFTRPPAGYRIARYDPQKLAEEIHSGWFADFWGRYDFADAGETDRLADLLRHAGEKDRHLRVCLDENDSPVGFIGYRITPAVDWKRTLEIHRMAWRDGAAYRALMAFLWSHRGQCATVSWNWPRGEFIAASLREPRVDRKPHYYWMGRPIDVRRVLQRRVDVERFAGTITIPIDDPAVPANTGVYTIAGGEVRFASGPVDNPIDLGLFSSIVFGSLSPREASLQADLPFDADIAEGLFRPRPVFITEHF